MRMVTTMLAMATLAFCVSASGGGESRYRGEPLASFQTKNHKAAPSALQANSLCATTEHIIFSCRIRGSARHASQSPGKIVSVCASPELDRERRYLQYRYGLSVTAPGKAKEVSFVCRAKRKANYSTLQDVLLSVQ